MGQFVTGAQPLDFWLAIALGIVFTIAGFVGAFVFFRRKRLIEDTPQSRIRSAAQGYVELQGTGRLLPGESIDAPLTGRPCLWYRCTIAERKRGIGRRSEHWQTIEEAVSEELFALEDGTGTCVVDPAGAVCIGDEKKVWYGSQRHPRRVDPPASTLGRLLSGRRRYRYQEHRISIGRPLYVLGRFRTLSADTDGTDADTARRELLRAWKRDRAALLARFDLNEDGRIDPAEWETARSFARNVVEQQLHQERRKEAVHMICDTADRSRPFVISTRAENQLAARYNRYFIGLLGLSLALGALLSYMIGSRTL